MIDNYLLEELVAFAKYGTLAKAADYLGLSQPAVTRGTKKLENDLGIKLFKREPNKIILTASGKFAAQKAQQVLDENQNFINEVKKFDQSNQEISLASVAPGPLFVLARNRFVNLKIDDRFVQEGQIKDLLLQNQYTCIVSTSPIQYPQIDSTYLGMENLTVNVNEFSNLASYPSVHFNDLKGLSFLVLTNIGIWKQIIQKNIPDAKFIYQAREENFNEIKNYSVFPFFTTNLSNANPNWDKKMVSDRIPVPIDDQAATQSFYLNYLKQNKKRLEPLIEEWQDAWEKVD
ncbi:LysR family transcriptional regulator [Limosilactobacillus sp. Sa3CUN2]|uniref:LysR family transcriptional regulator n=1 Tax=Limosilactobacillus avistercoris TaxID=2762243 RepID=A0ABR8PBL6_9LACO|nr:LysR family transcriptional regulator [Limosilactobacillus avistercoris]MBD7894689.1 LysR family transcriptional regulator [Limosilactobacillus avistercoris]